MTRARKAVGIAVAILGFALPARAEPIQIISGSLHWSGGLASSGELTLADRTGALGFPAVAVLGGFLFEGTVAGGGVAVFGPGNCAFTLCGPGTTIDLDARWVGSDVSGTARFAGETFTNVGSPLANSSLSVDWMGDLTIPAGFTGGQLTAPFDFTGAFTIFGPTRQTIVDLTGSGLASLTLAANGAAPGTFVVSSATYAFEDTAPVPEPMSLLLVGSGLAGIASLRRRRRPV